MEQPRINLFVTNNNTLMTTNMMNDIMKKIISNINIISEYNVLFRYFIDFIILSSCLITFIIMLDKIIDIVDNYVKKLEEKYKKSIKKI